MVGACPGLDNREGHESHEIDVEELSISNVASDGVKRGASNELDHRV